MDDRNSFGDLLVRLEELYNKEITSLNNDDETKDKALIYYDDFQTLNSIIERYMILSDGLSHFKELFKFV